MAINMLEWLGFDESGESEEKEKEENDSHDEFAEGIIPMPPPPPHVGCNIFASTHHVGCISLNYTFQNQKIFNYFDLDTLSSSLFPTKFRVIKMACKGKKKMLNDIITYILESAHNIKQAEYFRTHEFEMTYIEPPTNSTNRVFRFNEPKKMRYTLVYTIDWRFDLNIVNPYVGLDLTRVTSNEKKIARYKQFVSAFEIILNRGIEFRQQYHHNLTSLHTINEIDLNFFDDLVSLFVDLANYCIAWGAFFKTFNFVEKKKYNELVASTNTSKLNIKLNIKQSKTERR
jgi:hypothetical protein